MDGFEENVEIPNIHRDEEVRVAIRILLSYIGKRKELYLFHLKLAIKTRYLSVSR